MSLLSRVQSGTVMTLCSCPHLSQFCHSHSFPKVAWTLSNSWMFCPLIVGFSRRPDFWASLIPLAEVHIELPWNLSSMWPFQLWSCSVCSPIFPSPGCAHCDQEFSFSLFFFSCYFSAELFLIISTAFPVPFMSCLFIHCYLLKCHWDAICSVPCWFLWAILGL